MCFSTWTSSWVAVILFCLILLETLQIKLIGEYGIYFCLEWPDFSGTYYRQDNNVEMECPPSSPSYDDYPLPTNFYDPPTPPNFNNSPDPPDANFPTPTSHHGDQPAQLFPERFVETYEECVEAFPEGETIHGQVQKGSVCGAAERIHIFLGLQRKNGNFPHDYCVPVLVWKPLTVFCHLKLWVDGIWWSNLSLIISQMKDIMLSFCSAKELRTHVETLPSSPW